MFWESGGWECFVFVRSERLLEMVGVGFDLVGVAGFFWGSCSVVFVTMLRCYMLIILIDRDFWATIWVICDV